MTNIILFLAMLAIAVVALVFWLDRNQLRNEYIRVSQEKERLLSLVNGLDNLCMTLTREKRIALGDYTELTATYTVTDSDMIKYATDEEMEERVRRILLKTIVFDAINASNFTPTVSTNNDGKKVYSFHFHLKQV